MVPLAVLRAEPVRVAAIVLEVMITGPMVSQVISHVPMLSAGAMWWQWDMTNQHSVIDRGMTQVAYQDSTFQDVIAPQSSNLLKLAAPAVEGCAKINQAPPTATAGRRLLSGGRRA